ncbi:glycoside hydrolase superfamily [Bisporella sp. PMI_857]|nr:glycoside hydrolase superfamily [Bisporella sp. PMI_857]
MVSSAYLILATLLPAVLGQLNTLAKAKGLDYFGSATDNGELSDTQYVSILKDTANFGQITVGNTQKWDTIEPTQGTFSFTKGDVIANFAKTNGQLLRCHISDLKFSIALVWHSQLPSWVSSGTWTNATLIAALKTHIQNVVTHYKGQCYAWDVVNEAFNEDGTYRTTIFYNTIGPEYIPIAFQTAAQYDPTVKLYYNDYNVESPGAKSTAAQNLVKSLKARGIKIDGVGLQAHLIVGSSPSLASQTSNLNSITALGVEVAYTELDIRHPALPPTAAQYQQQATDYVNTVNACLGNDLCVGVTIWDYTDKYSWIPSVFPGQGEALPWNTDFSTKPAYSSVIALLGGKVTSTSSAPTATGTSGAGTLPKWAQCGGIGWTGTGTCVAGTTCVYSNDWYSQCL